MFQNGTYCKPFVHESHRPAVLGTAERNEWVAPPLFYCSFSAGGADSGVR